MLITLNEILKQAEEQNCAVGAFNTPNFECVLAVIEAAEELNVPVILSHAQLHDDVAPIKKIAPVMLKAAQDASVPVCVHLDHCETLEYLKIALDLGFTGVMYDGSALSYDENVANTCRAVGMARPYHAGVEAEVGTLPSREGGEAASGPVYTDPDVALRFCQDTGIDALAPSFGTAHGIYKDVPVLDFDRVRTIANLTRLPLVMHGGSGVSPQDYRRAIANGIRKVNYYSYMAKAGAMAVKALSQDDNAIFFHEFAFAAKKAMKEDVAKAMTVFAGK